MDRFWEILEDIREGSFGRYILGVCFLAVVGFSVFFFIYFHVDYNSVTVMDSAYYSQEELRAKVLKGPFAYNSVLAPIFCSKDSDEHPSVSGIAVTSLSRNSLCISVKEDRSIGCIPYLDSYVYFDINGFFTDSSIIRDEKIPFFRGINLNQVIKNEKIPFHGKAVLDTAIAMSDIFQKSELSADYIELDDANNITVIYGDIIVQLGKDQYLEDKMSRVVAILPRLEGKKGILHLESISDQNKIVTFEKFMEEGEENDSWKGGYDENGVYTGEGEYDMYGNHVGPKPVDEYALAREAWPGGYDEEGDFTGYGPYDENGMYVGYAPTKESIAANGDWKGGYDEIGRYITDGEYDRQGNYVGPRPEPEEPEDTWEDEDYSESEDSYYDEYYSEDYSEDYDYYSEDAYYDEEYY